jgi:hypothetical protein
MQFDRYEFNIAGHFASALINGDYTGLSDEDAECLNCFINDHVPAGAGHWAGFDEDTQNFVRDEVTGLWAECYLAIFMKARS